LPASKPLSSAFHEDYFSQIAAIKVQIDGIEY
jgi:hypothetical protein